MITIEDGLERIKTKYPQAHIEFNEPYEPILVVPGVRLGEGWNKTICTILSIIPRGFPAVQPDRFWVDLPDLRLSNGDQPEYTNTLIDIYGHPQWNNCTTWFAWILQGWNPNTDSLYTWLKVMERRLRPAR